MRSCARCQRAWAPAGRPRREWQNIVNPSRPHADKNIVVRTIATGISINAACGCRASHRGEFDKSSRRAGQITLTKPNSIKRSAAECVAWELSIYLARQLHARHAPAAASARPTARSWRPLAHLLILSLLQTTGDTFLLLYSAALPRSCIPLFFTQSHCWDLKDALLKSLFRRLAFMRISWLHFVALGISVFQAHVKGEISLIKLN
jgi:hypothetical protein